MSLESFVERNREIARRGKEFCHDLFAYAVPAQFALHYFNIDTGISVVDGVTEPIDTSLFADLVRISLSLPFFYVASKLDKKANSCLDEAWEMDNFASTGIYSKTRNPVYDADRLAAAGFFIMFPSALTGLIGVGMFVGTELAARGEEKMLEKNFGSRFTEYINTVPRFITGNVLPKYWNKS